MHLFNPSRPELGSGRKCLLVTKNAVPSFDMTPISATKIELEVMLKPDYDRGYIWYRYVCDLKNLSQFMTDYIADPELVLVKYFNWDPEKIVARKPSTTSQSFAPTIKTEPKSKTRNSAPAEALDLDIDI